MYKELPALSPEEILIYLRKSRSDDPTLSLEEVLARHEAMLDEWAERTLGAAIPEENRFREVVSGETIDDRPMMQALLSMVEAPRIKAILVVEVQRLSRGDLEDAGRIIKLLRYTNTLILTPSRAFDLTDEYDRDSFERELKRGNEYLEYTKRIMNNGRLLSVSQGNYIGNLPPYGYEKTWITDGKRRCPTLKIIPEQAAVVRLIFEWYVNENLGRTNICHRLDSMGIRPLRGETWSPACIKDMLANIHYIGKVRWNWRKTVVVVEEGRVMKTRPKAPLEEQLIYDGKHEAIISEELFLAAQEKQGRNHRTKSSVRVRNPFAGLVFCRCGRAMSLRPQKRSADRLICDDQVHCHTGSSTFEEFAEIVAQVLREHIADFEIKMRSEQTNIRRAGEQMAASLTRRLRDIEARELSQWELQAHPDPAQRMPAEIFQKLNAALQAEKREVCAALRSAEKSLALSEANEEKLAKFRDALDAIHQDSLEAERRNAMLKACIQRIVYSREQPKRLLRQKTGAQDTEAPLAVGGNWSSPPISLKIEFNI